MKSTRPKFETRRIRLVGPVQVETALALLRNVPLDADRPLELVVQEEPRKRGLDANAYYWLRLGEIAEQAWLDGRKFNSDIWHHHFRHAVMEDIVTLKDGKTCSKWIECPDGNVTPISTTQLEKGCFANYTEMCMAFGAALGVQYSANPRDVA